MQLNISLSAKLYVAERPKNGIPQNLQEFAEDWREIGLPARAPRRGRNRSARCPIWTSEARQCTTLWLPPLRRSPIPGTIHYNILETGL